MKRLFLSLIVMFFALPAFAEVNLSLTINLAGKQRMLIQKMAKEALLVSMDIDKDANLANLKATHDLFDKTLKGLKSGDESLGLSPVNDSKIQSQIESVMGMWESYGSAIATIVSAGGASDKEIDSIASMNMQILKEMDRAVSFYEYNASSDADMNPALSKAINISGRQRMLIQKMTKEFLFIAKGKDVDANTSNLKETISLFNSSLNGLINGDASARLSPAPTPEIKAQLEKVMNMWTEFKSNIESAPSDKVTDFVASKNLPLMNEMNAAVLMFESL